MSNCAGAKLRNVKFVNAVITGSEFEGTDLTGADFEDALIGNEDAKRLCVSPLLQALADMHAFSLETVKKCSISGNVCLMFEQD